MVDAAACRILGSLYIIGRVTSARLAALSVRTVTCAVTPAQVASRAATTAIEGPRANALSFRSSGWTAAGLLAVSITAPSTPVLAADARGPGARLECIIAPGAAPLLGNDRGLACTFTRKGAVAELYEGLTGIVTTSGAAEQTVVFRVAMQRMDAPAALEGDYAGHDYAMPGGATTLVGGPGGAVKLVPIVGRATTDASALNLLLGLTQLHLNYAGRVVRAVDRLTR